MADKKRRYGRRKEPNFWLILFQIVALIVFLIALLEVRGSIADGTSVVVDVLTAEEDVQVQRPESSESSDSSDVSGGQTDDAAAVDAGDGGS